MALYIMEPGSCLLYKSIDRDTGMVRNHVNRLHVLLVFGMQNGDLLNLWLRVHDSLGKLVVFLVNPRCLFLLFGVVERARRSHGHWIAY